LQLAIRRLLDERRLSSDPVRQPVAAISVGIVPAEGSGAATPMLDLCYHEDSRAIVDLNLVMADGDEAPMLVEVQGTGEDGVFSRADLDAMLDLALARAEDLFAAQMAALG
jgi:ribonuclease PH